MSTLNRALPLSLCAAVAVVFLGAAGCTPRKSTTPSTCMKNADCSASHVCVAGACVLDGCNGMCSADQLCVDGNCKTADGIDCSTQPTLCPHGFTCGSNGTCARGCTESSECPKPGFNICDVDKFQCVQCAVDLDCSNAEGKFCNRDTGFCVGCVDNTSCYENGAPTGEYCDVSTHSCQPGCTTLDECPAGTRSCSAPPGSPNGVKQCVQCTPDTASQDCLIAGQHACDPARLRCVQCNVDQDCATSDASLPPYCDPHTHQCVLCTDNSACEFGKVCDLSSFSCIDGCTGGSGSPNCPPETVCDPTKGPHGTCVACLQNTDCPLGTLCISQNGAPACVQGCVTDDTCPVNRVCDPSRGANGQCVGCINDQNCASLGLICDMTTEECRCKKEGEACSADDECGYRLIPDGNGGMIADCHAQGARCLTAVFCGPSRQERLTRNVCVVLGQGLADQCTPDDTGCPPGFINEWGRGVSTTALTKLCVPAEGNNICEYPFCGN